MGEIKAAVLGSMGWIPAKNRHTCCYCLEYKDKLIIFDAGTGMARFDEPWAREILKRYRNVLLLLSHYHMDHTAGLIYLPFFFKDKTVHIAGPGKSLYGRSVKDILSSLITPPYFGRPLWDFPMDLEYHDLGSGSAVIDGITVTAVLQEHSDPSLGLKIEDRVCYITDTACNRTTVDFVSDCKLLLHETWLDMEDYTELARQGETSPRALKTLKSHSSVQHVAEAARDAGVDYLLMIHLNPEYDEPRLSKMERHAREIFPGSHLARDRQTVNRRIR